MVWEYAETTAERRHIYLLDISGGFVEHLLSNAKHPKECKTPQRKNNTI